MRILTRTDHDTRLRDPGRRLAGERPTESDPADPGHGAEPSPPVIRARRARVNFLWGAPTGRRTER